MNAKAKAKKNIVRLVALLLAAMIFIGMLAMTTGSTTNTGYDFSKHLTNDGFFKDVTAKDIVKLPAYENYEMPKALTEISDEIVMQAIQQEALAQFATQEKDTSADRVTAKGDKVNINFAGTVDGEAFEGGTSENYDLTLGSGAFIPGFEDAVIGHKVGETFDIYVTFPEDYGKEGTEQAELNGKAAVFTVTINHAYNTIMPEFNDEFVEKNYSAIYSSAEDMKAGYKADLIDQQMKYYVETLLTSETELTGEIPETVKTYVQEQLKANLDSQGAQFGMKAEDMLILYGLDTMEEYYEMAGAETYEKLYMTAQAFFETEGIVPTDEDMHNYFKEIYGSQDYSGLITYYGEKYIKQSVMYERMLEIIIDRLPVVENLTTEGTDVAE